MEITNFSVQKFYIDTFTVLFVTHQCVFEHNLGGFSPAQRVEGGFRSLLNWVEILVESVRALDGVFTDIGVILLLGLGHAQ